MSDRTGEGGWMDSGHRRPTPPAPSTPPPPLSDQGSQLHTSRVGWGTMNAGLCPNRGHHIPLEPLCGAQQSGGEGRPGQDRKRRPKSASVTRPQTHRIQNARMLVSLNSFAICAVRLSSTQPFILIPPDVCVPFRAQCLCWSAAGIALT